METPRRQHTQEQDTTQSRRKYTDEEKAQLLANLDLEVKDRIRQFEAYLAHSLEAFKLRHENEVTRIPRAIRTLTIAEFADKYDGDVNKALQAITKARMEASGEPTELDASARKRKWQPSTDGPQEVESSRAAKNARIASPQKEAAGARPRLVKTPGSRLRRPPPSPGPSTSIKHSPSKPFQTTTLAKQQLLNNRMPSSTFSPILPKTPAYPRRPRANESLLSANGSPLTNPYELTKNGTGSPIRPGPNDPGGLEMARKVERQRSIAVLRGPSLSQPASAHVTEPPALEVVLSIKIRNKEGNILEFDPLTTTIGDLELLKGVSDDAKRQAKEELQELNNLMAKLGKWRI
ncbi:hypothetical protein K439DRAFT_121931 [Ramaria rubella]|nr:hypothetical protein K439DRAFT_121931 [Ramaria rubella]